VRKAVQISSQDRSEGEVDRAARMALGVGVGLSDVYDQHRRRSHNLGHEFIVIDEVPVVGHLGEVLHHSRFHHIDQSGGRGGGRIIRLAPRNGRTDRQDQSQNSESLLQDSSNVDSTPRARAGPTGGRGVAR
jgi:hypothetical protein